MANSHTPCPPWSSSYWVSRSQTCCCGCVEDHPGLAWSLPWTRSSMDGRPLIFTYSPTSAMPNQEAGSDKVQLKQLLAKSGQAARFSSVQLRLARTWGVQNSSRRRSWEVLPDQQPRNKKVLLIISTKYLSWGKLYWLVGVRRYLTRDCRFAMEHLPAGDQQDHHHLPAAQVLHHHFGQHHDTCLAWKTWMIQSWTLYWAGT